MGVFVSEVKAGGHRRWLTSLWHVWLSRGHTLMLFGAGPGAPAGAHQRRSWVDGRKSTRGLRRALLVSCCGWRRRAAGSSGFLEGVVCLELCETLGF